VQAAELVTAGEPWAAPCTAWLAVAFVLARHLLVAPPP
jgi:hypothetical protein